MQWPPVKAWTRLGKKRVFSYFVAINYGGNLDERWVVLVSVIDSKIRLKVFWEDFNDSRKWKSGWGQMQKEENLNINGSSTHEQEDEEIELQCCTHLSKDAGLSIPLTEDEVRPWFDSD